jgi:hypothetical protein
MTSSKPDKKSSSNWLSWGFIFLLAGGTLAAKMLLLVDNDLEIKTKFAGKSWQLDSQSLRKSVANIEKSTYNYFTPIGDSLRQQSTQLLGQADKIRVDSKDVCIVTAELSNILAQAKSFNPIESAHPTADKTDRVGQTTSRSNRVTQISTRPNSTTPTDRERCATTGVKK